MKTKAAKTGTKTKRTKKPTSLRDRKRFSAKDVSVFSDDFNSPYKFTSSFFIDGEYKGKTIYAIKFNPFLADCYIFAAVIENSILVFECVNTDDEEDGEGCFDEDAKEKLTGIEPILSYSGGNDSFYALAWSYDEYKSPTLAFGGEDGVLRYVVVSRRDKAVNSLLGHTGAINDLKFRPEKNFILLSASADHTIRMWNMKFLNCIAVFAGTAHSSQIISIDFDPEGNFFMAGGMDHRISFWNLKSSEVTKAINASESPEFSAIRVYEDEFTVQGLHSNFIDSVIWFDNNSFLSRSSNGDIIWWKTGSISDDELNLKSKKFTKLLKVKDDDTEKQWFIRMQVDNCSKYLVIGHSSKVILLWDLESASVNGLKASKILYPKSISCINMMSFSIDDSILIASSENGRILRFDKK